MIQRSVSWAGRGCGRVTAHERQGAAAVGRGLGGAARDSGCAGPCSKPSRRLIGGTPTSVPAAWLKFVGLNTGMTRA